MRCGGGSEMIRANERSRRRTLAPHLFVVSGLLISIVETASAQSAPQRFPDDFDRLFAAVELAPDRVLLTERGEQRPYVIEWRTGARTSVGVVGKGPREFQGPRRLFAVGSGHVAIEDPYRYALFPWRDGKVQEALNLRVVRNGYRQTVFAGADTKGRFLFVEPTKLGRTPGVRIRYNARELVAVTGTAGSARLDTVTRLRGSFRAETSVFRMNVGRRLEYEHYSLLVTEEQVLLFPDGWLAVLRKEPYRVEWRAPDGAWRRGPVASDSVIPVTADEKRYALSLHATALQRPSFKVEEFPNWPPTMPPFPLDALLPLPDGRLAVRRTPTAKDRTEWIDIFDRTGKRVDRWRLPRERQLIGIGAQWLYLVSRDDDDLYSLWRMRRPVEAAAR